MYRNRLLSACPESELEAIAPHLKQVDLTAGRVIYHGRLPLEWVYFIETGLIATTPGAEGEQGSVGAWIVGAEGMSGGVPLLLGARSSPHKRTVIASGSALMISRRDFCELANTLPGFRAQLMLYVHRILVETTQVCACTARHSVSQRVARILLTASDRLGDIKIPLTHKLVAQLLGIRRATVSAALQDMAARELVELRRSAVLLLDVEGMRGESCQCYDIISRVDNARTPADLGWDVGLVAVK